MTAKKTTATPKATAEPTEKIPTRRPPVVEPKQGPGSDGAKPENHFVSTNDFDENQSENHFVV